MKKTLENQKKFVVLGEKDLHEFDIIVDDNGNYEKEFSLYYSNNPPWSEHIRGTLALKLTDTGNNLFFDRTIKKLDYDIGAYVRILLNFASIYEPNKYTFTIVEQNVILKC